MFVADGQVDILSLIIFTPLVGALVLALAAPVARLFRVEVDSEREARWMRVGALAFSGLAFLFSITLALVFDNDEAGFQFVWAADWIGFFGIQYKVGVDGISLVLVLLTTLLTMISIVASFGPIQTRGG